MAPLSLLYAIVPAEFADTYSGFQRGAFKLNFLVNNDGQTVCDAFYVDWFSDQFSTLPEPPETVELTRFNFSVDQAFDMARVAYDFSVREFFAHAGYGGTTDGSGNYTVVFETELTGTPRITPVIVNQTDNNQWIKVTSVSTTGFTVNVFANTYAAGVYTGTTPVSGVSLQVTIYGY